MSLSQEQDYIGLPAPRSGAVACNIEEDNLPSLRATELRLGLPGSESPERKTGLSLFGRNFRDESFRSFFPGGFSDDVNGSSNWGFSVHAAPEADLGRRKLFLPPNGCKTSNKYCPDNELKKNGTADTSPASREQVVGWPPIRSFRKNTQTTASHKNSNKPANSACSFSLFVKVSMDGAPYLRKIDLKTFSSYRDLSAALEKMFSCFTIGPYEQSPDLLHGSEYVLTFEDKDGDWMLVGDVPWEMFMDSCKRLRIMKSSEAIGLAPRTMQKCRIIN